IMEIKPNIENMTINEYLKYEAEKERRLWRNVRSKSSPTSYKGADFNSSHRDKSVTLDFLHYYEDVLIDKYYAIPPLLLCFRPSQPHNECGYENPNENDDMDIESMTIAEYNLYVAKRGLEKNHKTITPMDVDNISDLEKEEAQEEDGDDEDIYDFWDIMVKDVEWIRQFLTPNVPDVMDDVTQL
ncbi:hypothetical protein Tco_1128851, partial [Tanacetum coccineum]